MTYPGAGDSPGVPGSQADPATITPGPADSASDARHEFAPFYRDHIGRLTAYLVYQGATAYAAADIAQDAMITAYQRWPDVASPRAYTWKVAYRAFLRHALNDQEEPVGEVPEPATLLPRPGEAESWLQQQHVVHTLQALPPRQRQVLALTIDGWSPAEIAELLDVKPAAVRSNLMKARRNADKHRRAREEAQ